MTLTNAGLLILLAFCASVALVTGVVFASISRAMAEQQRFPQLREIASVAVLLPASFFMAKWISGSGYAIFLVGPFFASLLPSLIAALAGRWPFFYGFLANTLLWWWIEWSIARDYPIPDLSELCCYWATAMGFALAACLPYYLKWNRTPSKDRRSHTLWRPDTAANAGLGQHSPIFRIFIVLVLFALALFYFRFRDAGEQRLLERATKIGNAPPDMVNYSHGFFAFYPQSEQQILLLQRPARLRQNVLSDLSAPPLRVFRMDVRNGHIERMPSLETAITASSWRNFSLSPDGKWLLCTPAFEGAQGRLVDLRAARGRGIALPFNAAVVWYPDSANWLILPYDGNPERLGEAFACRREAPDRPVRYRFTSPFEPECASAAWNVPPAMPTSDRLTLTFSFQNSGVTPWRQTIITDEFQKTGDRITHCGHHRFDPPDMQIDGQAVRISPDGSRCLWTGTVQQGDNFIWKLFTAEHDGSDFHRIGAVRMASFTPSAYGAEWMPNGKTIAFVADKIFYTIEDR